MPHPAASDAISAISGYLIGNLFPMIVPQCLVFFTLRLRHAWMTDPLRHPDLQRTDAAIPDS